MRHPLLFDDWDFIEETYSEAMARYSGFGAKLFDNLNEHIPGILLRFRFFRAAGTQDEDVFAVHEDDTKPFCIQLAGEVICIWSNTVDTVEIGDWSENEYKEAIEFIEEHFLTKTD